MARAVTPPGPLCWGVGPRVLPRYWYGEIRLTRLNFYARILLRRSHYHRIHCHYSDYFAKFYAPVLIFIGLTSVVLSSLQVIVQLEGLADWVLRLGLGVSIAFLLITVVTWLLCLLAFLYRTAIECRYALRNRREGNPGLTRPV